MLLLCSTCLFEITPYLVIIGLSKVQHRGSLIACHTFSVLDSTTNSDSFLLTLEAIWIRDIKPKINTKDEFRSRELIIRI